MKKIGSSILISAPPKKVWELLDDFGNYIEWNPFQIQIQGDTESQIFDLIMQFAEGIRKKSMGEIISKEIEQGLSWKITQLSPHIPEIHYQITLKNLPGKTLILQEIDLPGEAMDVFAEQLIKWLHDGMDNMNRAIRWRFELN